MGRTWQIANYGSKFFVNVLDEQGGRVAWQLQREHAELIVRAVALLPDDQARLFDRDPDDEDNDVVAAS